MAFDSGAFDSGAFDSGSGSAGYFVELPIYFDVQPPPAYSVPLPLDVSVADARVFGSEVGAVAWSARVIVGGVDMSSRLTGTIQIDAEEDAARVASLEMAPASADQLSALEGAAVSVDITVSGGGYSASRRRFAGVVESVTFSAASRVASLSCRDEYQDRIRAAGSETAVRSLLGGLETVSPKIVAWNADEPDPAGYFSGALGTVPGATYIDGAGSWRVVKWDIGTPDRTYSAGDMFDPGPVVETAQRAELPSSVVATLSHRFNRLHNAELGLTWQEPERVNYITRGIFAPQKSMVAQALENLGDWIIKGEPVLASPLPGNYAISVGGQTVFYIVSYEAAPFLIRTLNATIYRRWYQDVERNYRVTIDLGGLSDRDESIRRSIRSDFNASEWEAGRRSDPSLGIYTANPPPGSEDDPEPTGYEALEAPWPPANGSLDHFADLSSADVQEACRHVIAEATKKAAEWRRRQRVSFDRPADLRLDLGSVVGVNAYGVAAVGQVSAWSESYDIDSGGCVGGYTLATPHGDGTVTGFTATITVPSVSISKALIAPTLSNHIGADANTPDAWVNPDTLAGYLCNTLPTSDFYDDTAPAYETQFRIVLPEISATFRDPVVEDVEISADINLADSGLTITF